MIPAGPSGTLSLPALPGPVRHASGQQPPSPAVPVRRPPPSRQKGHPAPHDPLFGPAPRDQPRRAGPGRTGQPRRLRPSRRASPQPARLHPPVNLVGWTATTDQATKTVLRSYSTTNEPTGRLLTACGNRRSSRCPPAPASTPQIPTTSSKPGSPAAKKSPRPSATTPRLRHLHSPLLRPRPQPPHHQDGHTPPLPLRHLAPEDSPMLGTPLKPKEYDYTGAVLWNAHAGALWARFTVYLRRTLAAQLGMTQQALNGALRVSFAKVAEYHKRGLVHFHAVIRFDGPDGHTTTPPRWATTKCSPVPFAPPPNRPCSSSNPTPLVTAASPGANSSTSARSPPSATAI
ncbi:replication initiator [Streptomyces sp. M10(2022)]